MDEIDILDLMDQLEYFPSQGVFIWKISRRRAKVGEIAGSEGSDGFVRITVFGKRILGHELAWAMMHGSWPVCILEHINGDRSDNRIEKLRPLVRYHIKNVRGELLSTRL